MEVRSCLPSDAKIIVCICFGAFWVFEEMLSFGALFIISCVSPSGYIFRFTFRSLSDVSYSDEYHTKKAFSMCKTAVAFSCCSEVFIILTALETQSKFDEVTFLTMVVRNKRKVSITFFHLFYNTIANKNIISCILTILHIM